MKTLFKYIIGAVALAYYVGCAPVKFDKAAGSDPCSANPDSCVVTPTTYDWDYTIPVNGGLIDILFVNDNSGSMSFEQNRMADRFDSFLSTLDSQQINYRIGVITTDVSTAVTSSTSISYDPTHPGSITKFNEPRGINGNGALQDGKLITIPGLGKSFLSSTDGTSTQNRKDLFAGVIKRNETLQCENFLRQYPVGGSAPTDADVRANCPSGDERGMFAANLFVRNNPSSFIRSNAGFAIVFLADEDERSGLYTSASYALQNYDLPQTLVAKLRTDFLNKPVKVHSIITKDSGCLSQQSNQINTANGVSGSIGDVYRMASESTGGIVGDICAPDYGSQLTSISNDIVNMAQDISLKCETPANLQVSFIPASAAVGYNVVGSKLSFTQRVNTGTKIRLKYTCPQ